jgi:hypothetical protein
MTRGGIIGLTAGALVATAAIVAPALGASEQPARIAKHNVAAVRGIGSFTPAAADPRLAALFARGGFDASSFRFTPAESRQNNRAVTVAVRARTDRGIANTTSLASTTSAVGIAPIAYNLGMSVGWKRFAISGDVDKLDLGSLPGSRETADLSVSYAAKRFSGTVKAAADRPLANTPHLVEEMPSYSVDLGGSYSLTRNLAVTAGVRYRSDRERFVKVDDDRRDSQAVYLGTAFRF